MSSQEAKRKAVKQEDGPNKKQHVDFEVQPEIENFQREALWRAMQDYKRRSVASQDALDKLQKSARFHDEHLRLVDLWWDQCLHEICSQAELPTTAAVGECLPSLSTRLVSALPDFEAHLSEKRQRILDVIVGSIRQLRGAPQPQQGDKEALKEQNAALKLQLSLAEQRANVLQQQKEEREPQLQDLQDRLAASQRKVDRQKSITLARIEAQASKRPAAASPAREKEEVKTEAQTVHAGDSAASDQALEASNARLLEELGQLQVKLAELQATNEKLTSQLAHLSQSDVEATEAYKQIVSANAHLRGRQEVLETQLPALQAELHALKKERSKFQDDLAQASQHQYEEAVAQLTRTETDLARVRQARDELHSSLQVRKAQDEQKQTSARELGELADAQASRIAALEAEVARLKEGSAAGDAPGDDATELSKLQRENSSLKAELPIMEAAFSKAHEQSTRKVMELVSMEDRIGRLQAEKAKADQKYFAAMKAKDQLAAEIRVLKQQQQKATELATKLQEAEESCRQKVQNLERQRTLADKANEQLRKEVAALAESSDRSRLQLDSLHGKLADAVKRAEGKELEVAHATQAKRVALEELERLKKQQERLTKQDKAILNGDSDQLQVYRTMAMCSVCNVRWKNTTLVSCGHVFCKECVDKRTETRQRRCPSCNKGFGTGDVLAVHL
ncbi:BRE1 E3 ubiquitin ligase-domain-containing protein [Protomyces lactucae-debilis]|uniref:E3 ubiquitin protein ligase n=1 Tax=Protomyces lactucae-debilis TaxID=2754530 RepID=A0A1Y2F839_PROLT|nr:BRE1 E3 ubiquitin ligase-domain-containing protein [Protomyces lactucae-debilis]ORY80019.1 BRE1 E3 ubiquitin ligase-domain-containing protein [Protomyces lactucae-debilis]